MAGSATIGNGHGGALRRRGAAALAGLALALGPPAMAGAAPAAGPGADLPGTDLPGTALPVAASALAGPNSAARTDYAQVVRQLRAEIPAAMKASGTVGLTISLVDGNRTIMSQGFGYADRARGRRVTKETLFHIGSVSKTFTALAVMQLVERGLVDLDAPLANYVPEFTMRGLDPTNPITVREVLDHHSGIPGDLFNGLITLRRPDHGFPKWLLRALSDSYPERQPNEVYAYSNSGYVLLGMLVRNVSGMPLDDYARKYLFAPMGMGSSTFDDREPAAASITGNYLLRTNAAGEPVGASRQPREYVNGWAAGSILSNAKDMAKYVKTLLRSGQGTSGRIVSPETLRQMWTVQVHPEADILYAHLGLGFVLGDAAITGVGPVVWHDGGTLLNFSLVKMLPGSSLGVFVSVNTAGSELNYDIANRALALAYAANTGVQVPAAAPLPEAAEVPADPAELASHSGLYAGAGSLMSVAVEGTRLAVTFGVGTSAPVTQSYVAGADGWYRSPQGPRQLAFRDVGARHLLLSRMPAGAGWEPLVGGQRLPVEGPPPWWLDRLGRYREVDRRPGVVDGLTAKEVRVELVAGVPVIQLPNGPHALQLGPAGSLCTAGLGSSLGRGIGHCLMPVDRADGTHQFVFRGVRYRQLTTASEG